MFWGATSISVKVKSIFIQDKAPSHSAKIFSTLPKKKKKKGFKHTKLMEYSPVYPDIYPIENSQFIISRHVSVDGKKYSSKEGFWKAIRSAVCNVNLSTDSILTKSMERKLMIVIK